MTLALLFPGQGVQHADMLPWLEAEPLAAPVLAALAERLGRDWRARCADAAWATRNRVAQPLVVGLSLAAWAVLGPRLPPPSVVAGYSVGELAAYAAGAVLDDLRTALELADIRAACMDASGALAPGGLCAVRGMAVEEVARLGEPLEVSVAIRIALDRCVIGGRLEALGALAPQLSRRGAEWTPLPIGVASHTRAMAPAAEAFARRLASRAWHRPRPLVVSGPTGRGERDPARLAQALAAQLATTIEWWRCEQTIAERRPRCVLEVGPGTSLSKMWAAHVPDVPVRSVDEFRSADAVCAWVRTVSSD